MQFKYVGKISVRDLRKKSTIAILLLISISALFINAIYSNIYVYSASDEYFDKQQWPTEIIVGGLDRFSNENLTKIVEGIKEIDGVKWIVVHGDGILILDAIEYKEKNFTIIVEWCNVDDPTFPSPKFLVEGNFFKNNNEDAIILENFGKQLLEDIKVPVVVGSNGTKLEIGGIPLTIAGIVGNPLTIGNEEGYITRLTNVIYFYVPLLTYYRLISALFKKPPQSLQSLRYEKSSNTYTVKGLFLPPGNTVYVKVKEGYSVENVADKIRKKYPDLWVSTYTEYRHWCTQHMLSDIPVVIGIFIFVSLVMVWETRYRKKDIATLKALGWTFKDTAFFFTLRNIWLALIASILSSICVIAMAWLELFSINWYQINLYLSRVPPITPIVIAGTLLFSLPSMYFVYKASVEEAVRE